MKRIHLTYLFLLAIIALGTVLRFYRITTVPPSLSHDETAITYNAYSILKTAKMNTGAFFLCCLNRLMIINCPAWSIAPYPQSQCSGLLLWGTVHLPFGIPHYSFGIPSHIRIIPYYPVSEGKRRMHALMPTHWPLHFLCYFAVAYQFLETII